MIINSSAQVSESSKNVLKDAQQYLSFDKLMKTERNNLSAEILLNIQTL